jgi:uncharacterized membrane protein
MTDKKKDQRDYRQCIGGRSLSKDASGRIVYTNRLLRRSFFLSGRDLQTYSNISARYAIALTLGILLWAFTKNIPFGILSAVAIAIALDAWFYYKFLTTLDVAPDVAAGSGKERKAPFAFVMSSNPVMDKTIKILIGAALGALLLSNLQQQAYSGTELYLNIALIAISFAFAAIELVTLLVGLLVTHRNS